MKTLNRLAVLLALAMWATMPSAARESKPAVEQSPATAPADDNMTPYRKLATDTLAAFKAHDLAAAKKKAQELEVAWDNDQKALQKKSPDIWGQIDKAMDDFIKPLAGKSPDAAKVQTAYDTFIAKLQLAVKVA